MLSQLVADLEEADLAELVALAASLRKECEGGVPLPALGLDESLLRDLQVIEHLALALKGSRGSPGGGASSAGGGSRGSASSPLVALRAGLGGTGGAS